jgi:type II secretory pathway pseudopilin PulG
MVPALALAPAAVLAAIAVPNFLEAQTRAKVARVQSDMRSLATAIESFNVDTNKYPPSSPDPAQNLFGAAAVERNPALKQVSTFKLVTLKELGMAGNLAAPNVGVAAPGNEPLLMPLTTPIAYITALPSDVFAPGAPAEKTSFCYYSTPDNKWIVWSAGPDGQYDVTTEDLTRVFAAGAPDPHQALTTGTGVSGRAFTFDPTNGTKSTGDVWKVGGNLPAVAPPVRPAGPAPVGLPGGMR